MNTEKNPNKCEKALRIGSVISRFWVCSKCDFKVKTGNWKPQFTCKKTTIVSEDNCNMYWINEVSESSFNER
jgi:ribosomal protein L37AE/L43A